MVTRAGTPECNTIHRAFKRWLRSSVAPLGFVALLGSSAAAPVMAQSTAATPSADPFQGEYLGSFVYEVDAAGQLVGGTYVLFLPVVNH